MLRSVTARVRAAIFGAAIVAVAWSAPSVVRACSCAPPRPPVEAAHAASVVLEGRTFGVTREGGQNRFTFEVLRVWKGEVPQSVQIWSASNSAACGRAFETGLPYLVYAHDLPGGLLGDGLCSRTRPVANAAEDLELLGAGHAPLRPPGAGAPDAPSLEPPRIEPVAQQTAPSPSKRGCAIGDRSSHVGLWMLVGCTIVRARRGVKR
jgi:hypothetical protein